MDKLSKDGVKKRLLSFANKIYDIPEDFYINEQYLNDLTKKDFIEAFQEYRNIIKNIYLNASNNLIEYGYASVNKNTNEEKLYNEFTSNLFFVDKLIIYHHFIKKLCDASKIENQ